MSSIFILQLIASFFIGGSFIALITFLSELFDEKISGIILMFPTTIVLGFFFLGWTTSPMKVSEIIPATIIPLGLVVFSSAIYIYTATFISKFVKTKINQIFFTFIISVLIWFILAIPFAVTKFSNFPYAIIGYIILVIFTHYLLNRVIIVEKTPKPDYSKKQKILRALFMGTMIATVVFLGKKLNPFWGGVFTMFPVATFSALITFHFYYEPKRLFIIMQKAPLGSLALFTYTLSVMILFPKLGLILGTICSYLISLTVSLIIIKYIYSKKQLSSLEKNS